VLLLNMTFRSFCDSLHKRKGSQNMRTYFRVKETP